MKQTLDRPIDICTCTHRLRDHFSRTLLKPCEKCECPAFRLAPVPPPPPTETHEQLLELLDRVEDVYRRTLSLVRPSEAGTS
jgi:hypothetical protein